MKETFYEFLAMSQLLLYFVICCMHHAETDWVYSPLFALEKYGELQQKITNTNKQKYIIQQNMGKIIK